MIIRLTAKDGRIVGVVFNNVKICYPIKQGGEELTGIEFMDQTSMIVKEDFDDIISRCRLLERK